MIIGLGCDEAALDLKEAIKTYLAEQKDVPVECLDFGANSKEPVDYPLVAEEVALAVANGEAERGILMCGTGIGMAIAANKVPGVRAAQCHDVYSAERARRSNDAQILTMGARVIGIELAKKVVQAWLLAEFDGGASARKVGRITEMEHRYRGLPR